MDILDAYDHASSTEITANTLQMESDTRNTVVKIERTDRVDDGGVVTWDVSRDVDPFCSSGVRSVEASARRFPLSAVDGNARSSMRMSSHWSRFWIYCITNSLHQSINKDTRYKSPVAYCSDPRGCTALLARSAYT